jgi:hypothetical protein
MIFLGLRRVIALTRADGKAAYSHTAVDYKALADKDD